MSHLSTLTVGSEAGLGAGATEHFALFEAIRNGRYRQAKLLVEGGADVNGRNARGETPLTTACVHVDDARARARFTRLLLDARADPNSRDAHGMTALMHASMLGLNEVVLVLLDYTSTDILLQDSLGNTALMYAAAFGHESIVKILLASCTKGTPTTALRQTNFLGQTALDQATRANHTHIASIMRSVDPLSIESNVLPKAPFNTPLSTPEINHQKQQENHEQKIINTNESEPQRHSLEDFPDLLKSDLEGTSGGILPEVPLDNSMNESKRNRESLLISREMQTVLAQEELLHPGSRPPTPARPLPHLPTLKGHHQMMDLNASQSSTRSEPAFVGEGKVAQQQLVNLSWTSLSRSHSEPQTLAQVTNNMQRRDPFDDFDEVVDLLDASTRSDPGLAMFRAGPPALTRTNIIVGDKEGNALHLPPIRNVPTTQKTQLPKGLIPIIENHMGNKLVSETKPVRRRSLKRRNEDSSAKNISALTPNESNVNDD